MEPTQRNPSNVGARIRELKKNSRGRRRGQAIEIFRRVFFEHVFALVTLFVSIFAELQLPSACLPKRKDRQ